MGLAKKISGRLIDSQKKRTEMNWLEIIELRSPLINRSLLETQLRDLIEEAEKEKEKRTVIVYQKVMINTDFGIHLYHTSTMVENSGSAIGLRLASALEAFGLVHHGIWVEMESKDAEEGEER